jgi:hypothetical protein
MSSADLGSPLGSTAVGGRACVLVFKNKVKEIWCHRRQIMKENTMNDEKPKKNF